MLAAERERIILAELNMKGKVTVNGLADQLDVSKETVRRDLDRLSQEKKLVKVHGGAIKENFNMYEAPYLKRTTLHAEEKKLVGKKAETFINDNDVVALGVGTTTLEIVNHLQNKNNVTFIFNGISLLNTLVERKNAGYFMGRMIFLGGEIDTDQMFTTGNITLDVLDKLYIDKAFVGAKGYSIEHGITSYYTDDGHILRQLMERSNEVYLVMDDSKIGAKSMYKFAEFDEVDYVICNEYPPENWMRRLEKHDVQWIKA